MGRGNTTVEQFRSAVGLYGLPCFGDQNPRVEHPHSPAILVHFLTTSDCLDGPLCAMVELQNVFKHIQKKAYGFPESSHCNNSGFFYMGYTEYG